MEFKELIGNEKVKDILTNIIKLNKIAHSYIFCGPSGIGKTLFAKEFAKMILCDDKIIRPCGKCKSCVEIENNNNPDFILISQEEKKIKIDQIRQLQEKIIEKPIISNKKIYVIKDADTMTKEAQNCLLKTLEEPPAYITIILIVENESMILNTIKSRCTKVMFNKIPNEELKNYLETIHGLNNITTNILKASNGSITRAINFCENIEFYKQIDKVFTNIESLNLLDVLNKLEFLYKNKEEIYDVLDYINVILCSQCKKNFKYIKYVNQIEETKKRLKASSNYDMCIDKLLYEIWEEV
ncbi:MAG: DNA polymerase III subunit delta' [Clostridia bacterium]|nr:DNA polymerase III subunit delta' [Clostridia bacterium]